MGKKREKNKEEEKREKGREGVKRGAWSEEEDNILANFIAQNGHGNWRNLPQQAGLVRCGKSCRLRWTNYLRPNIKRGPFSPDEESKIINLHAVLGNKWAAIASELPGRTDNDVKNFWNTHLRKRLTAFQCRLNSLNSDNVIKSDPPPPPPRLNADDYFLRLWNSQVGDSFRTINDSPSSRISSSLCTKAESSSRSVNLTHYHKVDVLKENVAASSMDDSSDGMLKLLLDFPVGDEDSVGLLEPPHHHMSRIMHFGAF